MILVLMRTFVRLGLIRKEFNQVRVSLFTRSPVDASLEMRNRSGMGKGYLLWVIGFCF